MQVPIGIIPKSENKTDQMVEIMDQLHAYVPSRGSDGEASQQVGFGGDCLTSMRARQAQKVRVNSPTASDALRGLTPFAADWHAKVNFISVCTHDDFMLTNIAFQTEQVAIFKKDRQGAL